MPFPSAWWPWNSGWIASIPSCIKSAPMGRTRRIWPGSTRPSPFCGIAGSCWQMNLPMAWQLEAVQAWHRSRLGPLSLVRLTPRRTFANGMPPDWPPGAAPWRSCCHHSCLNHAKISRKRPWHSPPIIPLLQEQVLILLCAIQRGTPVALSRLSGIINWKSWSLPWPLPSPGETVKDPLPFAKRLKPWAVMMKNQAPERLVLGLYCANFLLMGQ